MSIEIVSTDTKNYAAVTPAGAFYATSSPELDNHRSILFHVLREGHRLPFSAEIACQWAETQDADGALRSIFRLQRLGMLRGTCQPRGENKDQRLEDTLPPLLMQLSEQKKAVLADGNGFYLATSGFAHESAEELAALSADMISLQTRHSLLLKNHLRVNTEAWGLLDPSGRSELGFWPLFIGAQRFMLIISGPPRLQDQAFVTMVQELDQRYS